MITIVLSTDDRELYGAPDPLVLDVEALKDVPADQLIEWETECEIPLGRMVRWMDGPDVPDVAGVRRVIAWLALQQAGRHEVAWAKFVPRLLRAQFTWQADPPDGGTSPGSSGSEVSVPSSEA